MTSLETARDQHQDLIVRINLKIILENRGQMAGAEVLQLYISQISPSSRANTESYTNPNSPNNPNNPNKKAYNKYKHKLPIRELKGFKKVFLDSLHAAQVEWELWNDAFTHYDPGTQRWRVRDGVYKLEIGYSSRDIQKTVFVQLSDDPKEVRMNELDLMRSHDHDRSSSVKDSISPSRSSDASVDSSASSSSQQSPSDPSDPSSSASAGQAGVSGHDSSGHQSSHVVPPPPNRPDLNVSGLSMTSEDLSLDYGYEGYGHDELPLSRLDSISLTSDISSPLKSPIPPNQSSARSSPVAGPSRSPSLDLKPSQHSRHSPIPLVRPRSVSRVTSEEITFVLDPLSSDSDALDEGHDHGESGSEEREQHASTLTAVDTTLKNPHNSSSVDSPIPSSLELSQPEQPPHPQSQPQPPSEFSAVSDNTIKSSISSATEVGSENINTSSIDIHSHLDDIFSDPTLALSTSGLPDADPDAEGSGNQKEKEREAEERIRLVEEEKLKEQEKEKTQAQDRLRAAEAEAEPVTEEKAQEQRENCESEQARDKAEVGAAADAERVVAKQAEREEREEEDRMAEAAAAAVVATEAEAEAVLKKKAEDLEDEETRIAIELAQAQLKEEEQQQQNEDIEETVAVGVDKEHTVDNPSQDSQGSEDVNIISENRANLITSTETKDSIKEATEPIETTVVEHESLDAEELKKPETETQATQAVKTAKTKSKVKTGSGGHGGTGGHGAGKKKVKGKKRKKKKTAT